MSNRGRLSPRAARAAASAAVLVGLLATAGSAQAARGMEIALQDDGVLINRQYSDPGVVLERAEQMGVTRIRVNVLWARVVGRQARRRSAPATVNYNWGPYDTLIDAAAERGIRVQLALTAPAPAWATANRRVGVYKPKPGPYAAFARATAEHFKGRVDRYSIWNEPNWVGWLSPLRSAPGLYRRLYQGGFAAIKRADPRAQVLIGETAPTGRPGKAIAPLKFLRAVTCTSERYRPARRCPGLRADGFAHHPYALASPPRAQAVGDDNVTLGSLDRLTRALDRLAATRALRSPSGRRLDLYLTEYGYFARGPRRIAERRRAAYLRQGFQIAQRNRRVRQMLQYQMAAPPRKEQWDTSLLTSRGRPKGAFNALRSWARRAARTGAVKKAPRGGLNLRPAG